MLSPKSYRDLFKQSAGKTWHRSHEKVRHILDATPTAFPSRRQSGCDPNSIMSPPLARRRMADAIAEVRSHRPVRPRRSASVRYGPVVVVVVVEVLVVVTGGTVALAGDDWALSPPTVL